MKVCFALNNRNKVKYCPVAIGSILTQKTSIPFEVILSDQGSTDGSKEVMNEIVSKYDGPLKVRRLDMPDPNYPGMHGMNLHFDYIMENTDADVVLQLSADDYALPDRVEKVVEAFEQHNPSMVLNGMYYVDEEMKYLAESAWPDKDGWCVLEEMFAKYVGGSGAQAWTSAFYKKMQGLGGQIGSQDVVMPFLAVLDKGCYYIHKRMHCYRKVSSLDNTGLEGVLNAIPETDVAHRLQTAELIHFQVIGGLYTCLKKASLFVNPIPEKVSYTLANAILDRSASWTNVREQLSLRRIPPLPFRA